MTPDVPVDDRDLLTFANDEIDYCYLIGFGWLSSSSISYA